MSSSAPLLRFDASWMQPVPRAPLDGTDDRRPDPAMVGLQAALMNNFDIRTTGPYPAAAISIAIPDQWDVPAAGAMKTVIDAVKEAGLISDDRNQVRSVRLSRYALTGICKPSVNVAVLQRLDGQEGFIREYWPNPQPEPASGALGGAVSYAYVSGTPGELVFSRGPRTPAEYEAALRSDWQRLVDTGALEEQVDWTAFPSDGLSLRVFVPSTGNFDPDNVLLRVLDLLEVARRDVLGPDAGQLTIDHALNEILLGRRDSEGILVEVYTCDQVSDQSLLQYFGHRFD